MYYDIVAMQEGYRGTARAFPEIDAKEQKEHFKDLMELYFAFCGLFMEEATEVGFLKSLAIYKELLTYGIQCELIVYDTVAIEDAFGYSVEYLGMDMVHGWDVSFLYECENSKKYSYLNENGLCDTEEALKSIVPLLDAGDAPWEPCYVYKVRLL